MDVATGHMSYARAPSNKRNCFIKKVVLTEPDDVITPLLREAPHWAPQLSGLAIIMDHSGLPLLYELSTVIFDLHSK